MSIRNKIECSVEGCQNSHEETRYNEGHPNWGHVVGIVDEHGEAPHLCPDCLERIKTFLTTGGF